MTHTEERSNQLASELEDMHKTKKDLRHTIDDLEMRMHDEQVVRQAAVQHAEDMRKKHEIQVRNSNKN